MRVLAAVVTYNRRELLSRCLDQLEAQSRPIDQILVINNGSTDGTLAMLQDRGILFVTQENVGSAGGWHRGIQHALEHGYEAVWLMDDDGYPDQQALMTLIAALRDGVACASSVVVREDDPSRFVFPFPALDGHGLPVLFGRPRKIPTMTGLRSIAPAGRYPFAHFFNGALLSVSAVRKVGTVDRSFFVFGEEVDYFFRLRAAGQVISVLSALHYHPDVSQRPYTLMKVYYYLKNTLVLNARYFDWVWLRHLAAVVAVLTRTARRNGFGAALSLVGGRSAPVFYSAIARGLRGRTGNDFDV
jgi:rhamnopyranosyl-N-acetylglucosaminyl-diphospho-decaprenol beta-1,3/1,4-galactofuranosyltransferase